MSRVIGILPAGGTAARFNGLAKELLPVSNGECALSRCARTMLDCGAEEVVILSSWNKANLHICALSGLPVQVIANDYRGVWETITRAGELEADWYYFAMPDTVFPTDVFKVPKTSDVMVGLFETNKPERFGMLRGSKIVDKKPGPSGCAWGAWIWSRKAMEYLAEVLPLVQDHTRGMNMLIDRFNFSTFPLAYYYDFAAFEDYREFLCGQ